MLETTVADGVAEVVLDHPPTNLLDGAMVGALAALLDRAEPDPDIRVLLLTSADPDFFCMHGDVRGILAIPSGPHRRAEEPNVAAALLERLHRSPLVSIGAVDGAARGGGAELLTALDLRVGGPRTVLGQPEVAMGILPSAGGTSRLPRLLGRSRALDVILSGRDVAADEAAAIGWIDRLVPSEEVLPTARALARRLAAMPPEAVAAVKEVVDLSLGSLEPALVAETDAFGRLVAAGGHRTPMTRFLEAGGQTREGERDGLGPLLDAMVRPGTA